MVLREFPDRPWFFLCQGSTATLPGVCIGGPIKNVIIWPSVHWRMFEIQDVGGANIYPLEYILLAGIFDRPPPPPAAPGASCWPFLYFCVCAASTIVCMCVQPKTVLGWSRIFPHVNSGFTASPRDGSGLFLFLVNSFDIVSKNATFHILKMLTSIVAAIIDGAKKEDNQIFTIGLKLKIASLFFKSVLVNWGSGDPVSCW